MARQVPAYIRPRKLVLLLSLGCCVSALGNCLNDFPPPLALPNAAEFDGRWQIWRAMLTIEGGQITSFTFEGDGRQGEELPRPVPLVLSPEADSFTFRVSTTQIPLPGWRGVGLRYVCEHDDLDYSLSDGLNTGEMGVRVTRTYDDLAGDPLRYKGAFTGDETRTYASFEVSDGEGRSIMRRRTPRRCCMGDACLDITLEEDCVAAGGDWVFDCRYEPCDVGGPPPEISSEGRLVGRGLDGRWDLTNEDGFGGTRAPLELTIRGGQITSIDGDGWEELAEPVPVQWNGARVSFDLEATQWFITGGEGFPVRVRITFDGWQFNVMDVGRGISTMRRRPVAG